MRKMYLQLSKRDNRFSEKKDAFPSVEQTGYGQMRIKMRVRSHERRGYGQKGRQSRVRVGERQVLPAALWKYGRNEMLISRNQGWYNIDYLKVSNAKMT
jgi:hypothetical protein